MLYGSHLLFSVVPLWAIALACYVFMAVPIQVLRNRFEGMQYQVAWSADFGCSALVAIALIGATILQRGVLLPVWLGSEAVHAVATGVAVLVGIIWAWTDWNTQWGDRYHHAAVAPVLTYLLLTLLPVIFWGGGTTVEIVATLALLLIFAILTRIDIRQKRMGQRQWMQENMGVTFKSKSAVFKTMCSECGSSMVWDLGYWVCRKCGATIGPSGRK